jgi:hypothetical protein
VQNPACLQVIPEVYNALAAKETRTRHTVILTLRVRCWFKHEEYAIKGSGWTADNFYSVCETGN